MGILYVLYLCTRYEMIKNTLTAYSLLGIVAVVGAIGLAPAAFAYSPSENAFLNNVHVNTQLNVQTSVPVAIVNNIATGVVLNTGSGSASLSQHLESSIAQITSQTGTNGDISIQLPTTNQDIPIGG